MRDGWSEEAKLRWRFCEPFGVEIDCDFSKPLSEAAAKRFMALFRDHSLVVAHDQTLNRDQHNALVSLVGPIIAHRDGDPGYIRSDGAGPGGGELSYHADAAYSETPFEALSLHALDVVANASSTRFVNVERALDTLPERLRAKLEAHDADMMSAGLEHLAIRICEIREHQNPGARAQLPSVRTNARTGRRYVAVSEMHAAALVGMEWEESRDTLTEIFQHLYASPHIHEHSWRNGDLIIWDNIACQHARGPLRDAGRRVLQRVIVGPKSVPAPHTKMA